jgi:xanthine dehydrogenase accessory factor
MGDERFLDGWGVLEHAAELRRAGEEFVLATVVWREAPSSGQHGSRAIVTTTGEIRGWIGGACAEPVLIREALEALGERRPRLLALGTSDQYGDLPQGTTAVAIACQSEGALQIFIEPVLSVPHLVVVGRSPMAHTLAQLARDLDWHAEVVDGPDVDPAAIDRRSAVVIATQGHGDEDALEHAIAADPVYLGVVASAKRGEALRGYLTDRGVPGDVIDAIRVPVGLDLGRTTHKEVAVSILAQLVQLRVSGALDVEFVPPEPAVQAIDPICGMTVTVDDRAVSFEFEGETFYFCCAGCRSAFQTQVGANVSGEA